MKTANFSLVKKIIIKKFGSGLEFALNWLRCPFL